nr:inovirus-type Gp2 protein [uncultured Halomonas sp.]
MFQEFPKRHPHNTKLRLYYDHYYKQLPVQQRHSKGPLIENYLETLYRVMTQARDSNRRTYALRLDLRFPDAMPAGPLHYNNAVISEFLKRLEWEHDLIQLKYPPDMRYVWCREQDSSDKPHYHALLLFNGNALCSLGTLNAYAEDCLEPYGANNLYHRIVRSWEGAIGWPAHKMEGLVNVAKDPFTGELLTYQFYRDDQATFEQVYYGGSYLCKAATKPIGQNLHCLEGSRL